MRQLLLGSAFLVAATFAVPASAQYARDYGYNGGYNNSSTVRCESNDGRVNRCPLPYGGGRVVVERQLSRGACIEGRSWGQDRNAIWVSQGCRADFRSTGYGNGGYYGNDGYYGNNGNYGNSGYGQTVRCESNDGRTRRCAVSSNGRAQLVRQLSRSACVEGRTWGQDRNAIWVAQGCRGDFQVMPGYGNNYGNGYGYGRVFRCESNDGRVRECAANTRAGVQLVRQLSRSACIEGRTWGYGRTGIWVAEGCRAEFRSY